MVRFVVKSENRELIGTINKKNDSNQIIILIHGLFAHSNDLFFPKFVEELNFSTFRYDQPGCGLTSGDEHYGSSMNDVIDLHNIILSLKEDNWNVVAVIGHSKGGNIGFSYFSTYPTDSIAFISIAARFVMDRDDSGRFSSEQKELLETEGQFLWTNRYNNSIVVTKADYDRYRNTNNFDRIAKLNSNQKICIVHGNVDRVVPYEDGTLFHKNIENSHFITVENGGHVFRKENTSDDLIRNINNWLESVL
eukprot:TRINITY_DN11537_c0_g1_i1.p1 TRINITY_DN11537_c0_g1~~TRINITY_DN11537_c0_g1_i1.p1  ORF type:complete len:250 (-),score=55.45 TRINITY_DN11537_c0_g1_i1:288-1037(-)